MIVDRASVYGFLARLAGSSFYTNSRPTFIRKLRLKPQVPGTTRAYHTGPVLARSRKCLAAEPSDAWVCDMLEKLIRVLFRCSHKRLTLPMTPVDKTGVGTGRPYVVCLDCGGQFAYDWKEMRIGARLDRPAPQQRQL